LLSGEYWERKQREKAEREKRISIAKKRKLDAKLEEEHEAEKK